MNLKIIFVVAILSFGLVLFGCTGQQSKPAATPTAPSVQNVTTNKTQSNITQEEYCVKINTSSNMSLTEAKQIALNSECANGSLTEIHMCNEITGTWWIDLDIQKAGCSPACVIDVVNKTAEINWRCTGLIPAPVENIYVNCSTNESCFYNNLASCRPTRFEVISGQEPQLVDAQYTIIGSRNGSCLVEMTMLKFPNPAFEGTVMNCLVPQNATTPEAYQSEFNPLIGTSLLTDCSGTYIDAMKKQIGS